MQTTPKNREKPTTYYPRNGLQEEEQSRRRRSLGFKIEEGIGEYKFEGIENDEGQSGTIYNTNSGKGSANPDSQTNQCNTTYDISIGETAEGVKARDTKNDHHRKGRYKNKTNELKGNMTYGF